MIAKTEGFVLESHVQYHIWMHCLCTMDNNEHEWLLFTISWKAD